jgi:hypothetical protein
MHEAQRGQSEPPPYVVVCFEIDSSAGEGHEHVLAVETRDPDGGTTRWGTSQAIDAVRAGERFVVDEEPEQPSTAFEPGICPGCATVTLAIGPGGTAVSPCA